MKNIHIPRIIPCFLILTTAAFAQGQPIEILLDDTTLGVSVEAGKSVTADGVTMTITNVLATDGGASAAVEDWGILFGTDPGYDDVESLGISFNVDVKITAYVIGSREDVPSGMHFTVTGSSGTSGQNPVPPFAGFTAQEITLSFVEGGLQVLKAGQTYTITHNLGSATLEDPIFHLESLFVTPINTSVTASSLVGTYHLQDGDTHVALMFVPDGRFFFIQDGEAGNGGMPGIEQGSYTWDSATGAFTAEILADTNGEWGFSHGVAAVPGSTITLDGNLLTLTIPGEGAFTLSRVQRSDENPLVGGWWIEETPVPNESAGGVAVAVFLSNGGYFMGQDGDSNVDPSGQDGLERGTYTWDSATGAFTVNVFTDTNGEWGFSHMGAIPFIHPGDDNNHIELDPDEDGDTYILQRAIPGTEVISDWTAQLGLTGPHAEPNATPFSDGLPNILRYALNLGVNPEPEKLPLTALRATNGRPGLVLEFRQRLPLVGVSLIPQYAEHLGNWEDLPPAAVERLPDDDPSTARFSVTIPADVDPRGFLRLKARVLD